MKILICLMMSLAVLAACASEMPPTATPWPTVTPWPTATPVPTHSPPTATAEPWPALQAYAEAVCVEFTPADGTWGNGAELLEVMRDHLVSVDPPPEAEAYHEAWIGVIATTLRVFRSMPAHELADGPTYREHPDVVAALERAEAVSWSPEANRHMEDAGC